MSPVTKTQKCPKCHGYGRLKVCPKCKGKREIVIEVDGKPPVKPKVKKKAAGK